MSPASPRTVCILTGGADKPYALGLATALAARGVSLDFIGSDEIDGPELHGNDHIRFFNLRGDQRPGVTRWTKVRRVLLYYLRLLRYAASAQPRIFHILWNNKIEWFDRSLLLLYYRLLGKRLVLTVHNVNAGLRDGTDSRWNRLTLSWQYRLAQHLFVHTDRMKSELLAQFPVPPGKVSVIPFGINDTLPVTPLTAQQARKRLGLAPSEKVLLFFGNIAPYKGLEYLVQALARLGPEARDHRLIVAGRPKDCPDYWQSIQTEIDRLQLRDRILLAIDYIPDAEVEVYFKAADILALPYVHIFQSGVLVLSYRFGLPVVATDVGSIREDVIEGRTGWLCRPRDPDDLARALTRFFQSPLYRDLERERERIRQFAWDRFSWSTSASIMQGVYERLAP